MAAAKQARVVNVFFGEESYLLDRDLRRSLKWPQRHITSLDGESTSEDAIVSALEDLPTDERGIVVVVDNAEQIKVKGDLLAHVATLDPKDASVVLVAICRCARLSKGWAELAEKGRAVEHPKLKSWERDKIKARAVKEAEASGLLLDDLAFDTLFTMYGEQTGLMANEIRKMALLLGKGGLITRDLVLSVCGRRIAVAPWDVSEAAFAKDPKRALRTASLLFQDKGDEVLVPIVASLMKQLEQVLIMRSMLDQKRTQESIAAALGIHPYRVEKELPVVRKHTVSGLLEQMKKLCELEIQVKGAAPAKRTLVELAVLSLAA